MAIDFTTSIFERLIKKAKYNKFVIKSFSSYFSEDDSKRWIIIFQDFYRLSPQFMLTVHLVSLTDNYFEWNSIKTIIKIKNFIEVNFLSKRAEVITR